MTSRAICKHSPTDYSTGKDEKTKKRWQLMLHCHLRKGKEKEMEKKGKERDLKDD